MNRKLARVRAIKENEKKIIKCKCGTELLLIPDLEAMSKAIEKHVAEHAYKTEIITIEDIDQIRDLLITKVFEKTSNQS